MEEERLKTIEQYDIHLNIWYIIEITLIEPINYPICHALGRDKVLILGSVPSDKMNETTKKVEIVKHP